MEYILKNSKLFPYRSAFPNFTYQISHKFIVYDRKKKENYQDIYQDIREFGAIKLSNAQMHTFHGVITYYYCRMWIDSIVIL